MDDQFALYKLVFKRDAHALGDDRLFDGRGLFRSTEKSLKDQNYPVIRRPESHTFAWVHAIRIINGEMDGGADPATDGMSAKSY
jgi:gamma-glutamyltranspeptidase/glutathione hydrolase